MGIVEQQGWQVRRPRHLGFEQLRECGRSSVPMRVVPFDEQTRVLGLSQDVDLAQRNDRIGSDDVENLGQVTSQPLNHGRVEEVTAVLDDAG
ncbi:MAG: hypothetical protein ACRDSI_05780, partial [Pseudonocardiaceae bacterium]